MFGGDPDYEEIKTELEPFITKITAITPKRSLEYLRFKENFIEWNERFVRAIEMMGIVQSIESFEPQLWQDLKTKPESQRQLSVLHLYRYLGSVESVGTTILDLLVVLLIANGYNFHVERVREVPRIVHAVDFKDLRHTSLQSKIEFIKRNGLKKTSKFIDRELRNAIAHLSFKMDSKGKTKIYRPSEGKWKNVNIRERINTFNRKFSIILILLQEGLKKISADIWSK